MYGILIDVLILLLMIVQLCKLMYESTSTINLLSIIIDQYVVDERARHLFRIPISFLISSTICITQLCISVSHSAISSSMYGKLSVS